MAIQYLSFLLSQQFPLCDFWNSDALQAGLFVYDIFWVFFTPVMVSVAKSFDAPIKVSVWAYGFLISPVIEIFSVASGFS